MPGINEMYRGFRQVLGRMRTRKAVKLLAGLALLEVFLVPLYACDPFHTQFDEVERAQGYEAAKKVPAEAPAGGKLVVMNWNAKFGGGRIDFFFDCHGDRVLMRREEVLENMAGLAEKIRQVDPDIVLLQEIDVNSKRAAYVDQMQYLLDHTELNYGAYASQWKADYVPTDGIGRVDSGNGILSKWPLEAATRLALPQIAEQDGLTRYFYLKRNILRARVELPVYGPLYVLNIHTDAYAHDGTKQKQLDRLKEEIDRLDGAGHLFVAGGDFNTLPPGSEQVKDFPDSVCEDEDFQADDFSAESEYLVEFYADYQPAIPLADYQADNRPYFTHTTDKDGFWNRKLDYLFTNGQWVEGSGLTHQDAASGGVETMPLSDHAPLTAILDLEVR